MVLKSVSVKSDRMGKKPGKKSPILLVVTRLHDSTSDLDHLGLFQYISSYFIFLFLARSRCTVSPLAICDFPRRILHYNHNFRKWFCSWRRSWKHVGTHRATSTGCFSFLWSVKSITSFTARILLSKIIIITELLSIYPCWNPANKTACKSRFFSWP